MIRILFSWALQFLILAGVGSLFTGWVLARSPLGSTQHWHVWQRFWFGAAAVVALLELWHLVLPVNGACWCVVAALGAAGQPSLWRSMRMPPDEPGRRLALGALFFVLLAALIAWRIGGVMHRNLPDDTEAYHQQIVRWLNEYPAVPGIANLQPRLALNSALLLYAALWDNLAWDGRSAWVTSCFFELVAAAQCVGTMVLRRRFPLPARAFALLALPFFLFIADRAYPTLYYDLFSQTTLLAFMIEALSLGVLARGAPGRLEGQPASEILGRAPLFLALATLSFAGKPIGAMTLLITAGACVLAAWKWRRPMRDGGGLVRLAAAALVLPVLIMLGYFGRNVVMSGWLLHPAPVLRLPLDWSLPVAEQQAFYSVIKGFARAPDDFARAAQMSFWEWFPLWRRGFDRSVEKQLLILGLAALGALALRRATTRWTFRATVETCLAGLCMANLAFWFVSAPDMRFGFAFFWSLMALGVGLWCADTVRRPAVVMGVALFVSVYFTIEQRLDLVPRKPTRLVDWGRARVYPAHQIILPDGTGVSVADNDDLVGDAPLPASQVPPPDGLRLRVPGNLRWGFRIEAPGPK